MKKKIKEFFNRNDDGRKILCFKILGTKLVITGHKEGKTFKMDSFIRDGEEVCRSIHKDMRPELSNFIKYKTNTNKIDFE